jgi:hypothetical protein
MATVVTVSYIVDDDMIQERIKLLDSPTRVAIEQAYIGTNFFCTECGGELSSEDIAWNMKELHRKSHWKHDWSCSDCRDWRKDSSEMLSAQV